MRKERKKEVAPPSLTGSVRGRQWTFYIDQAVNGPLVENISGGAVQIIVGAELEASLNSRKYIQHV